MHVSTTGYGVGFQIVLNFEEELRLGMPGSFNYDS